MCVSCQAVAKEMGGTAKMLAWRLGRMAGFAEPFPTIQAEGIDRAAWENADEDAAFEEVLRRRWPETNGEPVCPRCGGLDPYKITTRRKFKCRNPECYHQFSAVSGTPARALKVTYAQLLVLLSYDGTTTSGLHESKTLCAWRRKRLANGS